MKLKVLARAALLCVLAGTTSAAELTVLSSDGMTAVLTELAPRFERASGDHLRIRYGTSQSLAAAIEHGADFDVALLTQAAARELAQQHKASADTAIARCGIGLAVPSGAPKPDISSVAAFKRTLLAAHTLAFTGTGASGLYFEALLQRLGIAAAVNAKALRPDSAGLAALLAQHKVELAVQQISEIYPIRGADYVGPLPSELQHETVFSASIATRARAPAAAAALVRFMSAPAAAAVIRAKWMQLPAS